MIKKYFGRLSYDKKGLETAKTLLYILIAIAAILVFGWAVLEAAKRVGLR